MAHRGGWTPVGQDGHSKGCSLGWRQQQEGGDVTAAQTGQTGKLGLAW